MKFNSTPIASLLFILIFFFAATAQAQVSEEGIATKPIKKTYSSNIKPLTIEHVDAAIPMMQNPSSSNIKMQTPKGEIAPIPMLQSPYATNIQSQTYGSAGTVGKPPQNSYSSDSMTALEAPIPPTMLLESAKDSGPFNTTKPKIVLPTAGQISEVNNMVAANVAALKAQASATIVLSEHDNVALSYNASSGMIELSALNDRSNILEEIANASLDGVFVIQGNDKDNNLVIDETILDLGLQILYDGGAQETSKGDELTITNNGAPIDKMVVNHWNKSSGDIIIDTKSTITFTGLEPITNTGTINDIIFNLPNTPNPLARLESTSPGTNTLSGSTFESTVFTTPTNSLTINGGTDLDALAIQGLDPAFDAGLNINLEVDDLLIFQINPTNIGSGDLDVTTGYLQVFEDITTTGNIDLSSKRNTIILNNATLSVTDGTISIQGGTAPLITDVFTGVLLDNGNLSATGTGSISITGTGNNWFNSSSTRGVFITGTSLIETTTGNINITGTGGSSGIGSLFGIRINEGVADTAMLRSVDGNIILNGTGGSGTGDSNRGVLIDGVNPIQLTGLGSLDITGQGGTGAIANYGISFVEPIIMVADGDITLHGSAGNGSGDFQIGVNMPPGVSFQISGSGSFDVTGIGGDGTGFGYGVAIESAAIAVPVGGININGTAGNGSGDLQVGVIIANGGSLQTSGSGAITINGTGGSGTGYNHGVWLLDGASITTSGGDTTITGQGGTGGDRNNGIQIASGSTISDTTGGNISLHGTGGPGISNNQGIHIESLNTEISTVNGSITLTGFGGSGTTLNHGVFLEAGSFLTSNGGDIIVDGTGGNGSGLFNNGFLNLGTVQSVDGNITITGQGNGTTSENHGITVFSPGLIESTGSGAIALNGTGGVGLGVNQGIFMASGTVRSLEGSISMTGTGGAGTANNNIGIHLTNDAVIENNGVGGTAGGITLIGKGGDDGTSSLVGIYIVTRVKISAIDGDININGTAGTNSNNNLNIGVAMYNLSTVTTTGVGKITIEGTGGNGFSGNYGTDFATSAAITSNGGGISIKGTAGDGLGNLLIGIKANSTSITDLGMGAISLNGTGGTTTGAGQSAGYGVFLLDNSTITTNGGGVTIVGTSGDGNGSQSRGILTQNGVSISDLGMGTISMNGTGGVGTDFSMGMRLNDSSLTTLGGAISLTGLGGLASGTHPIGILLDTGLIDAGSGGITLNGTAGTGSLYAPGTIATMSSITSNGGGISITGAGGTIAGDSAYGIQLFETVLNDTGSGDISLNGQGGDGDNFSIGIVSLTSTINTIDGDIQITGSATDISGTENNGIFMRDNQIEATNGAISIEGASAVAAYAAIEIKNVNSSFSAGGTITATANVGPLNTPEGIMVSTLFDASNTSIIGTISPGPSVDESVISTIGQATITGDFDLTGGSLEVEVDNLTTPGTDYDQIVVTGAVDITGATLTLVDNFPGTLSEGDTLVIIENDGADAVTGTFNGLPNGTAIPFNGQYVFVYYDGGDGNDVILVLESKAVSIKAYLQGPSLNPNMGEETLMRDNLRVAALLPITSPYADGLTCDISVFSVTGADAIVDWVWVEFLDATDKTVIIASKSALLQRDGDIVDVDGVSELPFIVPSASYYIKVAHRNHLSIETLSAIAVLTSGTTSVDLSSNPAAILGGTDAVIDIGLGRFAMYGGDADDNGQVQNNDTLLVTPLLGTSSYNTADTDMNGQIQVIDISNLLRPNLGKGEQ